MKLNVRLSIIKKTIALEGGYVDHKDDDGGETNLGVTKKTARLFGYNDDMKNMSLDTAISIYTKMYWTPLKLDSIVDKNIPLAEKLFDVSVMLGPKRAGLFLQRCLNALNHKQHFGADITVDGVVGNKTLGLLAEIKEHRKDNFYIVLIKMLECVHGEYLVTRSEKREQNESFVFGWFLNRIN